jgi:hypothetical protein
MNQRHTINSNQARFLSEHLRQEKGRRLIFWPSFTLDGRAGTNIGIVALNMLISEHFDMENQL